MGRPLQAIAASVILAMTSTSGITSSGASSAVSTASIALPTYLGGAASTQVKVAAATANANMFAIITTTLTTAGKRGIEFWVYVDGLYDGSNVSVGGTGTVTLRNAGVTATLTAVISYHQGWNHIKLSRADFSSAVGGADFETTTFVDVTVKFDALASVTPILYFRDLSWLGWSRPQVAIVFDDGYDTVYDNGKPIMDPFGFVGTIGVIGSLVGTTGKMNLTRLNALHDAGWGLTNHSYTHGAAPFLVAASQAACYSEISQNMAYLQAQGWTRDGEHLDYIAPYGEISAAYKAAAQQAGCRTFWGLGSSDYVSAPSKPSFSDRSVDEFFQNRLSLVSGVTGAQITACLDRTLSAGRSCVVLIHSPVASPGVSLEVSTAAMTTMCQYLHQRRGLLDVVTLAQLYQAMQDPTK